VSGGAGKCGEGVDPGVELGGEFEGLAGLRCLLRFTGAAGRWDRGGIWVEELSVGCGEVVDETGGYAGCHAPVVLHELLDLAWERRGVGEDEQDVPGDVPG